MILLALDLKEFVPTPGRDLGQGFAFEKTLVHNSDFIFSLRFDNLSFLDFDEKPPFQLSHLLDAEDELWLLPLTIGRLCPIEGIQF